MSVLVLYCHLKTHPRTSWFIVIAILTVLLVVGDFGRCQLARSFLILNCIAWAVGTGGPRLFTLQFSSVAQSCPTLCDPMNCRTPCLPVHHHLLEFTQTHVHRVSDAIQPSHPLIIPFFFCPQSFPASGSFPVSLLFVSGGQSIRASTSASASVVPVNIQG